VAPKFSDLGLGCDQRLTTPVESGVVISPSPEEGGPGLGTLPTINGEVSVRLGGGLEQIAAEVSGNTTEEPSPVAGRAIYGPELFRLLGSDLESPDAKEQNCYFAGGAFEFQMS
jgi:hypothetical protein